MIKLNSDQLHPRINVNGQTLTYCTTLSAQVSSHCPSVAANCDEARHLISVRLSVELLGRLVNQARHKSHERRINVTSISLAVLGTCLQQHSLIFHLFLIPQMSLGYVKLPPRLRTCHRPKHRGDCSCFQSAGTTWLFVSIQWISMDSNSVNN